MTNSPDAEHQDYSLWGFYGVSLLSHKSNSRPKSARNPVPAARPGFAAEETQTPRAIPGEPFPRNGQDRYERDLADLKRIAPQVIAVQLDSPMMDRIPL